MPSPACLHVLLFALQLRADEPYARSRDYDLQHSKIVLRFDVDQKKVIGEVTHSLSILRDGTSKIVFRLRGPDHSERHRQQIRRQIRNHRDDKLIIPLPAAAKTGDKFDIVIRYEGKPSKGLYFILPDKDYPDRPKQIWTQGESEDTRYYLPTYDYPNDRLTTETILTVPASWLTVANGKLISVTNAANGMKTWTWKESLPSSTYLITVVAGEFDEVKDILARPAGHLLRAEGPRRPPCPSITAALRQMIELFNKTFGVDYPWEKYAQVMVDDFVAGGMENSSATTNTSSSLGHPKLAPEYRHRRGRSDLSRTRPSVVRRPGHLQGLGRHLAQRRFRHLHAKPCGAKRTFRKDQSRLRALERRARSGSRRPISTANRSCVSILTIPANLTATPTAKAAGCCTCCATSSAKTLSIAALKHYLEVNRGKNVVTADLHQGHRRNHPHQRRSIFQPVDLRRRRSQVRPELHLRRRQAPGRADRQANAKSRRPRRHFPRAGRSGNHHGVRTQSSIPSWFPKTPRVFTFPAELRAAHGAVR